MDVLYLFSDFYTDDISVYHGERIPNSQRYSTWLQFKKKKNLLEGEDMADTFPYKDTTLYNSPLMLRRQNCTNISHSHVIFLFLHESKPIFIHLRKENPVDRQWVLRKEEMSRKTSRLVPLRYWFINLNKDIRLLLLWHEIYEWKVVIVTSKFRCHNIESFDH